MLTIFSKFLMRPFRKLLIFKFGDGHRPFCCLPNIFTEWKPNFTIAVIVHRERKIGVVFSGETAEHIMDNHLQTPELHPLKHIRIQQLAKRVPVWNAKGGKRYTGEVSDNKTNMRYLVVAEIYRNFALIITCYKY